MNTTEIKGTRNVKKGELKQKSALLTKNGQLLDESNNEVRLAMMQVNLGQTKKDLFNRQTPVPAQWFSDWGGDGGERRRIEVYQSEAKNKKYDQLSLPDFLF